MNFLISKLSGLRVLCGETLNNCLPIHRIYAEATEQNADEEDGQREVQEDPFAQASMERQGHQQNRKVEQEEEEEERKHFKDDSTLHTASFPNNQYEMQSTGFKEADEYDTPFATTSQMTMQQQSVFDQPVNVPSAKPKASKKPMLGNIDEDNIQIAEKNQPEDEVDYFSQMNMNAPASNAKAPAKTTKKNTKAKAQEVQPDDLFPQDKEEKIVESKFNMDNDVAEDADGAAWGANDDDIDL